MVFWRHGIGNRKPNLRLLVYLLYLFNLGFSLKKIFFLIRNLTNLVLMNIFLNLWFCRDSLLNYLFFIKISLKKKNTLVRNSFILLLPLICLNTTLIRWLSFDNCHKYLNFSSSCTPFEHLWNVDSRIILKVIF